MTETYYDPITDGIGIEGFLNWANLTVDGWMATAFLFFIWLAFVYVGSKSEWKLPGVMAFSFFVCFIASMIMRVFTQINIVVIFVIFFGMAGSVLWSIIGK